MTRVLRSLTVHGSAPKVTKMINDFLSGFDDSNPKIVGVYMTNCGSGITQTVVVEYDAYVDTGMS